MKKLTKEELRRYRKFHIPGGSTIHSVKLNCIFLNKHNSRNHEAEKFNLAWEADKFITEAQRSATEEEIKIFKLKTGKKIVDFVDLTMGMEVEIVAKHENHEQIKFYRDNNTCVILVGEHIICEKCNLKYPRRNKRNICNNCKKEGEAKWVS